MDTKIDFFARREHFIDHLAPMWRLLPDKARGRFYIHESLRDYLVKHYPHHENYGYYIVKSLRENGLSVELPYSENPLVTCAYGDFQNAYKQNPNRQFIMLEHGVGLTPFSDYMGDNGGYAGGLGYRRFVDCFLAPNEYIAKKTAKVLDTMQYVVGTPKLDKWAKEYFWGGNLLPLNINYSDEGRFVNKIPTICISFHWNGSHVSPEAGNASSTFGAPEVLLRIKEKYNLVAHCHPKAREQFKPFFEELGIPFIDNFEDVMKIADIYINDCSSTMYEFLVTGKPVIIMNSPHFRKDKHTGIRFWDYTDIGYQVKNPRELMDAIQATIDYPEKHIKQRRKAVADLYPHLGNSAQLAVDSILKFTQRTKQMEEKLLRTKDYDKLIKLLSGADNTTKGISNIEVEHLCWLGLQVNLEHRIVEIGSHRGKSACAITSGVLEKYREPVHAKAVPYPTIHCIDLWQDGKATTRKDISKTFDHYHSRETWEIFNKQIQEMGFQNIIKPHKSSSKQALKEYEEAFNEGKATPIGLLFIDANHHEPWVEKDFQWAKYIAPGGYIALHDYGTRFPAVDRVVDEILKPSGEWEDYTVIGRIFSARKK